MEQETSAPPNVAMSVEQVASPNSPSTAESLELALHDLSNSYTCGINENDLYQFTVTLPLKPSSSEEVQKLHHLDVKVPLDYPQSPPTIYMNKPFLKQLQANAKDRLVNEEGLVDLKIIFKWNPEHTLYDAVNAVHVYIELAQQQNGLLIRDFAYPTHMPSHFGRYPLSNDQPVRKVKALFDFNAQDENELVFNVDDIIDVIYERADGWIVGMLNGISGLVPANHVEPFTDTCPPT